MRLVIFPLAIHVVSITLCFFSEAISHVIFELTDISDTVSEGLGAVTFSLTVVKSTFVLTAITEGKVPVAMKLIGYEVANVFFTICEGKSAFAFFLIVLVLSFVDSSCLRDFSTFADQVSLTEVAFNDAFF